jgi:ABC-type phosphate transport system substrate-binding protein
MRQLALVLLILVDAGCLSGAWPRGSLQRDGLPPQGLPSAGENLAIIVNRANSIDNLSAAELRRIFLGARGHWPSGRRITIVMMEPGQPERAAVLRQICQMSENEFNNHFLHGLFTGEVLVSPKILASPVGVRKFVFNVPGAIGYLRISDVDSSIKIVSIDEHFPNDKAYPLHVPAPSAK